MLKLLAHDSTDKLHVQKLAFEKKIEEKLGLY